VIEVTVTGVEVDNCKSTLSGLAKMTPAARPFNTVADVKVYVVGVVESLVTIEMDDPAVYDETTPSTLECGCIHP
jgi:hypothetical protein